MKTEIEDWMDEDPEVSFPCTDPCWESLHIDVTKPALQRLFNLGYQQGLEAAAKIVDDMAMEFRGNPASRDICHDIAGEIRSKPTEKTQEVGG